PAEETAPNPAQSRCSGTPPGGQAAARPAQSRAPEALARSLLTGGLYRGVLGAGHAPPLLHVHPREQEAADDKEKDHAENAGPAAAKYRHGEGEEERAAEGRSLFHHAEEAEELAAPRGRRHAGVEAAAERLAAALDHRHHPGQEPELDHRVEEIAPGGDHAVGDEG